MRKLWAAAGFVFVGLGALGVALPLVPTTPFLLLASYCFARSSPRFARWLRSTRLYKEHLEGFEQHRSLTLRAKLTIVIPVGLMLLGAFWMMDNPYGRGAVAVIFSMKLYYFTFRIRTAPPGGVVHVDDIAPSPDSPDDSSDHEAADSASPSNDSTSAR